MPLPFVTRKSYEKLMREHDNLYRQLAKENVAKVKVENLLKLLVKASGEYFGDKETK